MPGPWPPPWPCCPPVSARWSPCHHQQGLSHSEVAEVLGLSPGSVKTHLHRAHHRLAEILEDRR